MRFLVFFLVAQLVLAGCSQNGSFHASQFVAPTDTTITPNNPMVIQPRGDKKANPHVLGFLEVTEATLEKNPNQSELNFNALVSLKTDKSTVRWSSKVALRGQLDVDGSAVLYPVNGDVAGELPVRARVTCMSDVNPMDCDQAIIDIFVKEGSKTHAAQVIAEMRENIPPESFAPKKEEQKPDATQDNSSEEEEVLPPLSSGPKKRYANGRNRNKQEEVPAVSSGGPKKRYANGPAARDKRRAEEQKRQDDLKARMNPEVPEADAATVALLKKKAEERRAAEAKREADLKARMTPETPAQTPENKALEEALKKKYSQPQLPRTTPKTDRLPKTAPKTSRLPKVTTPKVETPAPVEKKKEDDNKKTEPVVVDQKPKQAETKPVVVDKAPTQPELPAVDESNVILPEIGPIPAEKPSQNETDDDDDDEEEGTDPTDRPSLYIGTLHDPSDDLFKSDRPETPAENAPIPKPRPRPEPKKDETANEPDLKTPTPPKTTTGARVRDQVIGLANKGSLQNSSSMAAKTPAGFKLIRPDRERHYGSYELVEIIGYLSKYAQSNQSIGTLQVGDLSRSSGGKIPNSRHSSHQNGLDVDIGYPMHNANKNPAFMKMVSSSGKVLDDLKLNETWALMKAAWATKAVDRIFMDVKIKGALCQIAKRTGELDANGKGSAAELLRRIRPTPGHATHFHLRILCSKDQPRCRMIGDPPRGSGC